MNKILTGAVLFSASISCAQAATIPLTSLTVERIVVVGSPNVIPNGAVSLNIIDDSTNLIGNYTNPIAVTNLGGNNQIVYTAATNQNPNGNGPAAGTILGGAEPSGTVNDVSGLINVDMSSWFSNHFNWDLNLGGAAQGVYNPSNGGYSMSWSATLGAPHPAASMPAPVNQITWVLTGVADTNPIPIPASIWLFGTGLIGLAGIARRKKTA